MSVTTCYNAQRGFFAGGFFALAALRDINFAVTTPDPMAVSNVVSTGLKRATFSSLIQVQVYNTLSSLDSNTTVLQPLVISLIPAVLTFVEAPDALVWLVCVSPML